MFTKILCAQARHTPSRQGPSQRGTLWFNGHLVSDAYYPLLKQREWTSKKRLQITSATMPDPSKIVRINTTSLPSIATRLRPARPPRKKALLIGVQYSENTGKLQSTYADVESISALLIGATKG